MLRVDEAQLIGNKSLASYIRRIIKTEEQIDMHRRIKNMTALSISNNNIQSTAIPTDKKLDWNKIPKKNAKRSMGNHYR